MLAAPRPRTQRRFHLVLLWMLGPICGLGVAEPATPKPEGRVIRLMANGISFRVFEPADWKLDLRSAPQLAAFILHPADIDWRKSQTVIYANFLPSEEKSLTEFLELDRQRFLQDCDGAEEAVGDSEARALGLFMVQHYSCPGQPEEVMAVAKVGDFHFVFLLTARSEDGLETALPVFEQVVARFSWSQRDPSP